MNNIALVDGDMVAYEAAFAAQSRDTGEPYNFEVASKKVEKLLAEILEGSKCSSYKIYLTGQGNFREKIATVKPYKGNRKEEKPYHLKNIRAYLVSLGAEVVQGMEADDALAINQGKNTCICTRDKDLRQVPGLHYGWEMGFQPEFMLQEVSEIGYLVLTEKRAIKGTGIKFFYSQIITGDVTDNIPGLRLGGAVKAYKALAETNTEEEMYSAVRELYLLRAEKDFPDEEDKESLVDKQILEQGRLLWMVRELTEEGEPVMWELPTFNQEDNE